MIELLKSNRINKFFINKKKVEDVLTFFLFIKNLLILFDLINFL